MADLFTLTAPLLICFPDGRSELMVERLPCPGGLVYFRAFRDQRDAADAIRRVEGEVHGEGPWKIGSAVITVLGCHGSHPEQAAEFADWQLHREQLGDAYPDRDVLRELARQAGYLS
jgi:hypothetical protein